MKKRIFSTLLALCMLLCLMPTAAFAEESTETPPVCSCETACTTDNMNKECPVCGAENAPYRRTAVNTSLLRTEPAKTAAPREPMIRMVPQS